MGGKIKIFSEFALKKNEKVFIDFNKNDLIYFDSLCKSYFRWIYFKKFFTELNLVDYPYLVSTKKEGYTMTREEIIMRLEAAIYDKDWAAVELLLEDLQVIEIEDDWDDE